ncbi:UNVERIFIED_CONTAM: hypothetical protein GTU68_014340 [Idotea baltica]|nr:hypothetical protein [Idotea baltica]
MTQPVCKQASKIGGWGHTLPTRVVDNNHFASYLETSDEWISSRTGIKERRWAEPEETASSLAEQACLNAIKTAGITPADIDGIIVATVTPDYQFPSTACFLQKRLGCPQGLAFDVNAVCSGFMYALATADGLLRSKRATKMLVVGVDLYSRIINPNDRSSCILFGDGAGAIVLEATEVADSDSGTASGVIHIELGSDAETLSQGKHFLKMEGREVFRLAVRKLNEVSDSVLQATGYSVEDVDYVVSHQANKRILDAMAKHMNIPESKVLCNIENVGNTSAASIPILLSESLDSGVINTGDLVMLSAFGGGVTWAAGLVRI